MSRVAVYRHYDATGALLYVGQSKNPAQRLEWCRDSTRLRWPGQVARTICVWFHSRAEAMDAERAAIKAERPQHNRRHNDPSIAKFAEGCG